MLQLDNIISYDLILMNTPNRFKAIIKIHKKQFKTYIFRIKYNLPQELKTYHSQKTQNKIADLKKQTVISIINSCIK